MVLSILTHFTHRIPNHHLLPMRKEVGFECGACKENLGPGDGYKCDSCDFMIHDACASMGDGSSDMITYFMHPQHRLKLLPEHCNKFPGARRCDVCRDIVGGMWYHCAACDFDVHPFCTKLPQFIRRPAHPEHQLVLVPGRPRAGCDLCKGDCSRGWIYRCHMCDFDGHLTCIVNYEENTSAGGDTRRIRKRDIAGKILIWSVGIVADNVVGNGVSDVITAFFS